MFLLRHLILYQHITNTINSPMYILTFSHIFLISSSPFHLSTPCNKYWHEYLTRGNETSSFRFPTGSLLCTLRSNNNNNHENSDVFYVAGSFFLLLAVIHEEGNEFRVSSLPSIPSNSIFLFSSFVDEFKFIWLAQGYCWATI